MVSNTEGNLQEAAYKWNKIIAEQDLMISVQKTKLMAFWGRNPITSNILLNNKIIEQIHFCKYFGNLISCDKEVDTDTLNDCLKITGIKLGHILFF